MVREAEDERDNEMRRNPQGDPGDWAREAAATVAAEAFPEAPHWEQRDAVREIERRMSGPVVHPDDGRGPPGHGGEFDMFGGR